MYHYLSKLFVCSLLCIDHSNWLIYAEVRGKSKVSHMFVTVKSLAVYVHAVCERVHGSEVVASLHVFMFY